jgi:hypothetical protein
MALLNIEIDESLLQDFRKFAVVKHGRIYGVLKPEVEVALRNHLDAQKLHAEALYASDRGVV